MIKKQISLKDPSIQLLLITIGIIIVTYLVAKNFILKPNKEKIANIKAKLEHIRAEDEIAKIQNEINTCEKSMPPQKESSWLLTQITEMARSSNIKIASIEPMPPVQIQPYTYVPLRIKTDCTFTELMNFIKLIESSPYILNIESIKLESKEEYTPEVPKEKLGKKTKASVEILVGMIY